MKKLSTINRSTAVIWIFLALIIIIVVLGILYEINFDNKEDASLPNIDKTASSTQDDVKDFVKIYDGTYIINSQKVTLVNGKSEIEAAPGSSSKIITSAFGNAVKGDFDADGREDVAFLVTQSTGGTGLFYYLVALLNKTNGLVGSEGLFLGDRIAPQSTTIGTENNKNIIIVNYVVRKVGENFTVPPSVGKSIQLLLDTKTMQFGEVAKNFEGEANPAKMTLGMKTWNWVSTKYSDGKVVTPHIENKFTLTIRSDKTFSVVTDCNGVGGEYSVSGNKITFTRMMSTLMYCENSQEGDFSKMLSEAQSYMFTSKGELILNLKFDSGSVIFK
ncbi:MAG: META domain-containing protein [bacterium]